MNKQIRKCTQRIRASKRINKQQEGLQSRDQRMDLYLQLEMKIENKEIINRKLIKLNMKIQSQVITF
ncbi:unnamed protein product [Paramecium sonneborni]|uniref:Uncharacterized protein n=1 Tax=Paramecium sonneborni TaxID=65129 RepID=A0A8S1MHM8_9CILI|nr:unnamed protein product [Paramecium sonneborni]